jgi:hypothetical protein
VFLDICNNDHTYSISEYCQPAQVVDGMPLRTVAGAPQVYDRTTFSWLLAAGGNESRRLAELPQFEVQKFFQAVLTAMGGTSERGKACWQAKTPCSGNAKMRGIV